MCGEGLEFPSFLLSSAFPQRVLPWWRTEGAEAAGVCGPLSRAALAGERWGRGGRSPSLEEDVGCGSQAGGGGAGPLPRPVLLLVPEVDFSRTQEARGRCMDLAGRRGLLGPLRETPPLLWCFRTRRGAGGRGSDSYLWNLASRGDTRHRLCRSFSLTMVGGGVDISDLGLLD